mmetsp:Transcript_2171/g.3269  ORF Transcript_2171/g.3269 Transcript_2171/m.3269 type:complete len:188 (-) Transcript_2171:483-1046(-)|eukprot:CAMPEP_0175062326 /NCGR_PEP_ID=MMETSP0052_2-20121109/14107_1 /TAXON_ID=51329 ORGANISM="Polytomella parva, Strain SAG 63-3" /NCGR_SAMPLE_ID=MMETSP0052_2 /ASSEMBLY_ACC=CAM_ASM_000194 /LENGTH=187 /DNA_ID=CAMNT_0016328337 /DNA_START=51 /DNA_END=614 /DNA_ORIENTATION=+
MAENDQDTSFVDFPLKQRRHYPQNRNQVSNLAVGMVPEPVETFVPHHLQRSRIVHDGADLYTDPTSFASVSQNQIKDERWTSSYQASCLATGNSEKKKVGKKTFAQPAASNGISSLGSQASAIQGRNMDLTPLQNGTTKNSPHIPGYTGHIPSNVTPKVIPPREVNKTLIVENYNPHVIGYTGRKKI